MNFQLLPWHELVFYYPRAPWLRYCSYFLRAYVISTVLDYNANPFSRLHRGVLLQALILPRHYQTVAFILTIRVYFLDLFLKEEGTKLPLYSAGADYEIDLIRDSSGREAPFP